MATTRIHVGSPGGVDMGLRDLAWSATHKAWQQMSQDTGAEFVPPDDFSHPGRVTTTVRDWTVTLRIAWFYVGPGKGSVPYTLPEAPYDAPDDFSFMIKSTSLGRALAKLLGFKGIQVDDPVFDRAYFVAAVIRRRSRCSSRTGRFVRG